MESLENQHIRARVKLQESEAFAAWAADDRQRRTPELTPEQREQLQNYLQLRAEQQPDIYSNIRSNPRDP
jgi:hypothetical protein